jgi:hypothetical protein
MPTLGARVASIVRTLWRKFFGIIGVSGFLDLVREFARGKAMEWIYQNLGSVGVWIASYKLAGFTIGIITVILWLIVSVVKETRARESTILDSGGKPYQIRTLSKAWARSAVAVSCVFVVLLVYGAYRFYRITPQVLLEKYPLGYVIFDVDQENSVFPYDTKYLLDQWDFDWSTVRIEEGKPGNQDIISVTLPNIRPKSGHGLVMHDAQFEWPKRVGPLGNSVLRTPQFDMRAEILAIRPKGIVFLIGFARTSMH